MVHPKRLAWLAQRVKNKADATFNKICVGVKTVTAQINPNPIIIIGNQKSGATAIAALLADMAGISVTLDLRKEIGNPTYHLVVRGILPLAEFIERNKLAFSAKIIKEPNLTLLYDRLPEYFPGSKFV
ncbi:unnamed protein product, partial [marine sediment metagenome]